MDSANTKCELPLTFDGNYAYAYDAWGRQVEVRRAFITKDANNTKTYHEGSTISTSAYDGRGRRIRKQITNSGDQDYTYIYYYDDQRIIEERNGADQVLKTYVWGNEYIDELIQINTYIDTPQSFWAMQDANFNILGVVNESGRQVERYEYTPYGERTIYGRQTVLSDVQEAASWVNDSMLTYPQLTSARIVSTIPVSLCDFGHQGLQHDPITGQIYDRGRMINAGRFPQRDPGRYRDGMNLYQYVGSNPVTYGDPNGEWRIRVGDEDYSYSKIPNPRRYAEEQVMEGRWTPQEAQAWLNRYNATGDDSDPTWTSPGPGLTAGRSHDPRCPIIDDCDRKCEDEIYGWGTTVLNAGELVVAATGSPVLEKPKPGALGAPSSRTSYASKYLSKWLPKKLSRSIPAPTLANSGARTATIGRFAGRVVPAAGVAAFMLHVTINGTRYINCVSRCKAKLNYRNRGVERYDYGSNYRQI